MNSSYSLRNQPAKYCNYHPHPHSFHQLAWITLYIILKKPHAIITQPFSTHPQRFRTSTNRDSQWWATPSSARSFVQTAHLLIYYTALTLFLTPELVGQLNFLSNFQGAPNHCATPIPFVPIIFSSSSLSHLFGYAKEKPKKKSGEKFLHVWLCKHDIERGPGSSVEIMDYGVRIVRCDEEGNFESWILDPLPNGFHCARMWVWVDACSAW